ncbi:MAG: flagellar motor protein MotA [Methylobacteriaceae bacterium]|nr:flagellar motor protein MotA [Methylobacteriaceae bacterium]MBV9704121.1 flagellar motor protein MotA [Methylobacteriaceae bacterium]
MARERASDFDPYRLSSPRIFLLRMALFLILIGFAVFILNQQIRDAFMRNPGLNGLIICVLVIGILLAFRQVLRLFPEIRWVNGLRHRDPDAPLTHIPTLLAPVAMLIGEQPGTRPISTVTLRVILDSVATRLDEGREINRYLIGLLVFLGLLGTFWGLIETVGAIGNVLASMQSGSDTTVMFDELKEGLSKPIGGMSISFTSSLFGLSGSLILGFLDLQAGQAQSRFYNEIEDNISMLATDAPIEVVAPPPIPAEFRAAIDRMAALNDPANSRATTTAMANLAEGIQGLVHHMRSEQQLIRRWVEAQAEQQQEVKRLLERLTSETERR